MLTNRFARLSLVILASIAGSSCASSQTLAPKPAPAPAPAATKPAAAAPAQTAPAAAKPAAAAPSGSAKKPNILFIMGDDIGWMQPSI